MDKIKGEGAGRGGRWVRLGGEEGWGENADNCNRKTIKKIFPLKIKTPGPDDFIGDLYQIFKERHQSFTNCSKKYESNTV